MIHAMDRGVHVTLSNYKDGSVEFVRLSVRGDDGKELSYLLDYWRLDRRWNADLLIAQDIMAFIGELQLESVS
jgi:hypothetical protein